MRLSCLNFVIVLPALLLCACQTALHESFPNTARDKVSSTDVALPISQNEIYVAVQNYRPNYVVPVSDGGFAAGAAAGAAAGVVGALVSVTVNSIRTSKAETAVKPLRDALVDFNFDQELQGEFRQSLDGVPWIHAGNLRVIKETAADSWDRALTESKAGAVLFVSTDYHLMKDGDLLVVTAKASLFPNDDGLRALKKNANSGKKTAEEHALYRNFFVFKTLVPGERKNRDKNIETWSAKNGEAMRTALKLGATKLAALLAMDLQRSSDEMPAKLPTKVGGDVISMDGLRGRIIGMDADGETIRFENETMAFVVPSAIVREDQQRARFFRNPYSF